MGTRPTARPVSVVRCSIDAELALIVRIQRKAKVPGDVRADVRAVGVVVVLALPVSSVPARVLGAEYGELKRYFANLVAVEHERDGSAELIGVLDLNGDRRGETVHEQIAKVLGGGRSGYRLGKRGACHA